MTSPIRSDPELCARYSQGAGIYRIVPQGVARPIDASEVDALIACAMRAGLTLVPRGAGSAMDGGNVGYGVVVDLTAFETGRCVIDAERRIARLAPSLAFAALNRAAGDAGLRLPSDPSSGAWATIGGMLSTNASGARTVRYGSVRRWVSHLRIATADGSLELTRGVRPDPAHPVVARWQRDAGPLIERHADVIRARYPKVTKNSAGYALDQYLASGDLLDIVVGAEGTLGIITDASMRLDAVPPHRASLRVVFGRRADLAPALDAVRMFDPSTLEFLDGSFLRLVGEFPDAAGLLLADFEGGDVADVEQRAAGAAGAARSRALDACVATDAAGIGHLWDIRHRASPILAGLTDGRRSLQVIEDGCVPVAELSRYLDAVDTACTAAKVDVVMFGHAGDGHVHVNLLPDLSQTGWRDRVRRIFDEVSAVVIGLGGTPSGEHGAGRLRAGLLERLYGAEVMECFRAVKRAFDPAGIFNPGVILGGDSDPFDALKIGAGAAPLPPGIAEELQRIEREARWGERRWR